MKVKKSIIWIICFLIMAFIHMFIRSMPPDSPAVIGILSAINFSVMFSVAHFLTKKLCKTNCANMPLRSVNKQRAENAVYSIIDLSTDFMLELFEIQSSKEYYKADLLEENSCFFVLFNYKQIALSKRVPENEIDFVSDVVIKSCLRKNDYFDVFVRYQQVLSILSSAETSEQLINLFHSIIAKKEIQIDVETQSFFLKKSLLLNKKIECIF